MRVEFRDRFRQVLAREGARGLLWRGGRRFLRIFFETNSAFWLEKDLTAAPAPRPSGSSGLRVTFDRFEETVAWIESLDQPGMLPDAELCAAREYGHCFASVSLQDRIVGYAKIGWGEVYIQDYRRRLALDRGAAFIYDSFVVPQRRSQGIGSFLLREVADFLAKKGYRCVRCHIPPWNIASLKAYGRAGFGKRHYARYVRLLCFSRIRRVRL